MQGFRVERKGGWDTHGLPVELKVEQELGLPKKILGLRLPLKNTTRSAVRPSCDLSRIGMILPKKWAIGLIWIIPTSPLKTTTLSPFGTT